MFRNCCDRATIVASGQRSVAQLAQAVEPNSRYSCSMPPGPRVCLTATTGSRSIALRPGRLRHLISDGSTASARSGQRREQRFQRASAFDPGELVAEAEMDSGAEGDVAVRPALQVEPLGMRIGLRVHVGGGEHRHDLVALPQPDAAELDIPAHIARLGELHRRDEAQKFLDREIEPAVSPRAASRAVRDSSDSSNVDPLIRCVVVSWPANSSRNTIDTISSRLIFPPSFSTRTISAISPCPPCRRTVSRCRST